MIINIIYVNFSCDCGTLQILNLKIYKIYVKVQSNCTIFYITNVIFINIFIIIFISNK